VTQSGRILKVSLVLQVWNSALDRGDRGRGPSAELLEFVSDETGDGK